MQENGKERDMVESTSGGSLFHLGTKRTKGEERESHCLQIKVRAAYKIQYVLRRIDKIKMKSVMCSLQKQPPYFLLETSDYVVV